MANNDPRTSLLRSAYKAKYLIEAAIELIKEADERLNQLAITGKKFDDAVTICAPGLAGINDYIGDLESAIGEEEDAEFERTVRAPDISRAA